MFIRPRVRPAAIGLLIACSSKYLWGHGVKWHVMDHRWPGAGEAGEGGREALPLALHATHVTLACDGEHAARQAESCLGRDGNSGSPSWAYC